MIHMSSAKFEIPKYHSKVRHYQKSDFLFAP